MVEVFVNKELDEFSLQGKSSEDSSARSEGQLVEDSLVMGLFFLFVMTIVQRGVGFARSVWFCQAMEPYELGQWNMANSFLTMFAPLIVLGIPGTLGRYVEHYRQREGLRPFLKWMFQATAVLTVGGILLLVAGGEYWSWFIFGEPGQSRLIYLLAGGLLFVVGFNLFIELFTAFRQSRRATILQFLHSLLFAASGLLLLWPFAMGASGAIIAYMVGSLSACCLGSYWLLKDWSSLPNKGLPPTTSYWKSLGMFAMWIWLGNLCANLFEITDRYMILHFSVDDVAQATALVGQYHSSKIVPILLLAVASMVGGVLLPYLVKNWEEGEKHKAGFQVQFVAKILAFGFTLASFFICLISPWLYEIIFEDKYDLGLGIVPYAFAYAIWGSIGAIWITYLWCSEHVRWSIVPLAIGVVANVVANYFLLPYWGIYGAIWATMFANGINLLVLYGILVRFGLTFENSFWLVLFVPLLVCLPFVWGLGIFIAVMGFGFYYGWLLNALERRQIVEFVGRCRNYFEK
ncbi:MAG: lipopolysaccharide biosynthesis protein [Pirellulaceae bacterium]|nr:lipopolysaccharide biosynthesis protein [Pirellulaceae bacterium]